MSANALFSDWKEIETVVAQGSILLFNIFLNIFCLINNDNLCNYADDNTTGKSLNIVKENLN